MTGRRFGTPESPRKDHRPLAANGRAYFFGNALGFNASTALTTYPYSSMPFDAASGNYYDHARFYNSAIGEFTQSDYGNYGSLADPRIYLPYTFTGSNPINLIDLNGHAFSLPDVMSAESLGEWLDVAFARGVQVAAEFARPLVVLLGAGASWMIGQGQNALQFLEDAGESGIAYLQQGFLHQEEIITEAEAETGPAWDNFDAAKIYLNKLLTGGENNPEGIEWHHLVMHAAENVRGFAARAINSATDLVPTPGPIHQAITSFFNSGANWLPENYSTVGEYVRELSWGQQYQIGLQIWQAAMYNQNLQEVGGEIIPRIAPP